MPSYRVKEKGFFDGRIYDPNGKRPVLVVDKPFTKKNMPSWVEPIKETTTQSKARQTAAKKQTEAAKKKAAEDKKDIENASFMGGGEVETL